MEENTQLPKEVVNAVYMEAEEVYNKMDELAREACHVDFGLPMFHKVKQPIEVALTAYAKKLHQADNTNKSLEEKNRGLVEENAKLKEQAEGWRPLLEEVLSKHESGLLPDRFIYEKIKIFLYGE